MHNYITNLCICCFIIQKSHKISEHNRKEAERFREENRRLSREKENKLLDLKVKHKAAMRRQAKLHSEEIEKKSNN